MEAVRGAREREAAMRSGRRLASTAGGALLFAALLWAPAAASAGEQPPDPGLTITKEQARELFGNRPARMLIQKWNGKAASGLWLLDFRREQLELQSIADQGGGEAFFHPDGLRIVHANGEQVFGIQLDEAGKVVDAQTIGRGGKCRWWTHPKTGDEYVIFPDSRSFNSEYPHGRTLIRKVKKGTVQPEGPTMIMLENLYMGDGRSADGKYVFGGLPATAIAEVEDPLAVESCKARILWNAGDACNVSMYTKLPGCFTYTDHKRIIFSKPVVNGTKFPEPIVLPNKAGWHQWLEWATDMDCYTFSENPDGKRPNGDFIAWILQHSTMKYVKVLEHGGCTHLWLGGAGAAAAQPPPAAKAREEMKKL